MAGQDCWDISTVVLKSWRTPYGTCALTTYRLAHGAPYTNAAALRQSRGAERSFRNQHGGLRQQSLTTVKDKRSSTGARRAAWTGCRVSVGCATGAGMPHNAVTLSAWGSSGAFVEVGTGLAGSLEPAYRAAHNELMIQVSIVKSKARSASRERLPHSGKLTLCSILMKMLVS